MDETPSAGESTVSRGDILVVDDNPSNLELLSGMLTPRRYRVRVANSGRRALSAAQGSPPDLVLLDISMPGMDGYEVCRQLKAHPRTEHVPVIFLSALDDVLDKVRAFDIGGADYLSKPFELGEVLVRMENQLKIMRLQAETRRQNEELRRRNEELLQAQRRGATAFSVLQKTLPGQALDGRYELGEQIGAGGFGAVYRARQIALDREVAVKVLHPMRGDSEELERFLQEGISTCRVQHPNAVAVIDSGVSSGLAYLVMELLDGQSLAKELKASPGNRLPPDRCLEIALPVVRVLAAAHKAGVLHRDIKPENIFLHHENGADGRRKEVVKVVDFGVAKLVSGDDTYLPGDHNTQAGTPFYMAPERLYGEPNDGRADIYSLGLTLYRTLAGSLPFDEPNVVRLMMSMVGGECDWEHLRDVVPEAPEALADAVMRCLSWTPEERPTAAALEKELSALVTPVHS